MKKNVLPHFFGLLVLVVAAVSQQPPPKVRAGLIPRDFSISMAMKSLFGNYDPATQSSTSIVPSGTDADLDGFFRPGDHMEVKAYLVSAARDEGVQKVFLLTFAVPKNELSPISFGCHMCAPLIGLAVFSKVGGVWKTESFSSAVTRDGQWGKPAPTQLVSIGPDRVGVELTDTYTAQGDTTKGLVILVHWEGKATQALMATVGDDDRMSGCGPDDPPCYSNHRVLGFVPGANRDYYDVELVLSGTDITDDEHPKLKTVSGVERLQFVNGKYARLSRTGDTTSVERAIAERDTSK